MKHLRKFNEGLLSEEDYVEIVNIFSTFFDEEGWVESKHNWDPHDVDGISYHIQKSTDLLFDSEIHKKLKYKEGAPFPFEVPKRWDGKSIKSHTNRFYRYLDIDESDPSYVHELVVINIKFGRESKSKMKEVEMELKDFIEDIKHYHGYMCYMSNLNLDHVLRIFITTKEANRFLGQEKY